MKVARLAVLASLLVIGILSAAAADNAAAAAKISAAQAAITAGKGQDAAAELNAVAEMLEKDAAGSGEYAQAMAALQARAAKTAADGTAKGKVKAVVLDIIAIRAADLYGALIPAGKGDLAAALAYVSKLAQAAGATVKPRLEGAKKALSDVTAGSVNKKPALGMLYVTLGSSVPLSKATDLIKENKPFDAIPWINAAAEYLEQEEKMVDEKFAEEIHDLALEVKAAGVDPQSRQADDIKRLMAEVETNVVDAYKPAAAPEEKAEPAVKKLLSETPDEGKGKK